MTKYLPWTPDRWDEGYKDEYGYFHVYRPDCPDARVGGWRERYRVVFWLETGRVVKAGYQIHHVDGDKSNDVFVNLREMPEAEHHKMHMRWRSFSCHTCGKTFQLSGRAYAPRSGKYCSRACYHTRTGSKLPVGRG